MSIEVIINGRLAYTAITDKGDMEVDAARAERFFQVQLLRKCGVPAEVRITGVQSKMNEPEFIEQD